MADAMPQPVHIQCAHNLGELIRQATDGKARVHDWWLIGQGIEASLPQMRTIKDDTFVQLGKEFVHGYCVGFQNLPRHQGATNLQFDDPFVLKVWGLYEWRLGNDTKNAEHIFMQQLIAIQNKVSKAPRLQIDGNFYGGLDGVDGHKELNFDDEFEVLGFGNTKVFLARGTIEVDVNVQLTQQ